jgi:hypothetical protein
MLRVEETVRGELDAIAVQSYDTEHHGEVNVFAEKSRATRSAAQAWVAVG